MDAGLQELNAVSRSHLRVTKFHGWVFAGYFAVALGVFLCRPFDGSSDKIFWDMFPLAAQCLAAFWAFSSFAASRKNGGDGRVWLVVGVAVLLNLLADSGWAYEELVAAADASRSRWIDVPYLLSYVGLIAGTLMMLRGERRRNCGRMLLDAFVFSGCLGLLAWDIWIQNVRLGSSVAVTESWVVVAYPPAGVCLLTCSLCLLRGLRVKAASFKRVLLWSLATGSLAVADVAYSYQVVTSTFEVGKFLDLLWVLSVGFMAWSCFEATLEPGDRAVPDLPQGRQPSWLVSIGFVAMGPVVVLGDFAYNLLWGETASTTTLIMGIGLLVLVAVRQVVFTLEQHRETEKKLRAFNEELEATVKDRTGKLAGLLRLASAVNNTVDVAQVLEGALGEIRTAIPCAGAVAWRWGAKTVAATVEYVSRRVGDAHACSALAEQAAKLQSNEVVTGPFSRQDFEGYVLAAPLQNAGEVVGWIALARENDAFESDDLEMMAAMSLLIGPALEHALAFERLAHSANLDPVTGLFNHRSLHQILGSMFADAKEQSRHLSLLMMDLTNFRMFNATYGHPIGDQVLTTVASILTAECPPDGVVGRFGGDEFVVVLPGCDTDAAALVARRFNEKLDSTGFVLGEDDRAIPLAVCTGVATFPNDADTYEELLAVAGRNLVSARIGEGGVACTSESQRSARSLREDPTFETLDMLVAAVDNKDAYTRRHAEEVAQYASDAATELGCSEETLKAIQTSALLHDVGKIGVPPEILAKPARLTADETAIINRHPWIGAMIVSAFPGLEELAEIIKCHHERWDGGGYPDGRAGDEIPWVARLLMIADTFSAMTTDRPYRRALSWEVALSEISKQAGTQFDPVLAEVFVRAVKRRLNVERESQEQAVRQRAA